MNDSCNDSAPNKQQATTWINGGQILLRHAVSLGQLTLGDVAIILKVSFLKSLHRIVAWALALKLLSCECHRSPLMRSQHWFREWFGAVRQQTITWVIVGPVLCRHMASLGHNDFPEARWQYMRQWIGSPLVQIMACRLFGAKPLSEPMLGYCQLDPWEQTSVEFRSKYKIFHSWKCI